MTSASVNQPGSIFSPATTVTDHAANDLGQLTLNQPLYSRGQLSSAVSVARAKVLGGRQQLRQQEAATINQVVSAYADVLLSRETLLMTSRNLEILQAEVTEIEAKVDAKALTLTDSAQAKSRFIAAQVQLQQARKALGDAAAKYQAAVGQQPGSLDPLPDLPGLPPSLGTALDAADKANPQLLTAQYTELASRAGVVQAKAADGIQVGLTASLGQQPLEPYLPNQYSRSVTTALVVSTPLFTSGAHESRVRAAVESNNRDALKLADARRQIDAAVVQAWSDLATQRTLLDTLGVQLEQEAKAFSGMQYEEHFGLRSTIDLLNAEQELEATRVSLAQSYHDEYLLRVNLLGGVGLLQAELIDPQIVPYRPEKSLTARTLMSRLLPWEGLVEAIDAIGAPREALSVADRDPLGRQIPLTALEMPPAPRWAALDADLAAAFAGRPRLVEDEEHAKSQAQ